MTDNLFVTSSNTKRSFTEDFWVFVMALSFAITFAYVESAVVVYLRTIFYPGGFKFPIKLVVCNIGFIELGREAMTIIMLITVAAISGRTRYQRWSYFLCLFGVWDIFFYLWLKVFIDWPESFFTWDILFLLPVPWTSPVVAVGSVALLITLAGATGVWVEYAGYRLKPLWYHWISAIAGSALIYYSFTIDWKNIAAQGMPGDYLWWMLFIGEYMLFGTSMHIISQSLKGKIQAD
jgi:hypothetical protein